MKYKRESRFWLGLVLVFFFHIQAWGASVQLHLDVGLNHFYKKRYLEAFREFKSAVEIDPKSADAHYNLGRVYKIQGFLKEAAVEFELAVSCDPRHSSASRELSELKRYIQNDPEVRLKIQGQEEASRIRGSGDSTTSAQRRGEEFMKKGDVPNAIAEFEKALKSDSYNSKLYKVLGFLYFRQNRFADALNAYNDAQRLSPGDAETAYAIGMIHLRTQNTQEAMENLKKAIGLSPNMVKAQFGLGEAYEVLGQNEDALFQYKKCLELNPDLPQALEKVRSMGSKLGFTYFSRGAFYYQQADYEKAEALLSLSRKYGSLSQDQQKQADEMLTAAKYWLRKKRVEDKERNERRVVTETAYINKNITVSDVVSNPSAYIGQSVEWTGLAICSELEKRKPRCFVNSNSSVDWQSNLDFSFGIEFPKELPSDPRVSDYSTIRVVGKVIGVEKILNSFTNLYSPRKQPIVSATEVTFSRENYEEPLTIRYY